VVGEVRLPELSDLDKQDNGANDERIQDHEMIEEIKEADPALA